MYSSFQLAKKYLRYYQQASNGKGHGMHSPFVFDFILHVLNNKNNYQPPAEIEDLRKMLLTDKRLLEIIDLGAGSRMASSKKRKVKELAKSAVKQEKYAQLLYRLVKHYQPKNSIELGTSLGISTAYLSAANPSAKIISIEGSDAIASIAKENFEKLHINNIELIQGNFDDQLTSAIKQFPSIDLAYIDGNHRYQPTMQYFQQLLPALNTEGILIFDDIYWSEEMEKAWQDIKQHPSVFYTIDIFFLGFVFFHPGFKLKQHFTIRF